MPNNKLPFVQAALLCEKVLVEQDSVLSAVRIIDLMGVSVPANMPPDTPALVGCQLLVMLKANGLVGTYDLGIHVFGPTATTPASQIVPVVFIEGHEAGANLNMTMLFNVAQAGPARIDLTWDGEALTSVPFQITRSQAPAATGGSESAPPANSTAGATD